MNRILLSTCLSLLSLSMVFAQEKSALMGKVIDKETHEPLSYCTILNKSNNTFTVANVNGDFRLSEVNASDTNSDLYGRI